MAQSPLRLRPVQREPGQSRYAALAAAIRQRVLDAEWPPGMALPAETRLATEHGVALGTLRRALEMLAEQGLIERRHGKGTFVRDALPGAPMLRFFRFGDGDGQVPRSSMLSRQTVAASAEVARRLGVGRGDPVLRLHRLRSLGGNPRLVEDIWLPLPLFGALLDVPLPSWADLLYPFFSDRCSVAVSRVTDDIGFAPLAASRAQTLRLPAGHPGVTVTRQAYDLAGRCVEFRVTHGDAFAFHYSVTIT
jgi:GntR family transcriptional regulator